MHTIRLREPRQTETLPGRCRYRRFFNRPTGLTASDIVRLAVEQLPAGAIVRVNGQAVPENEGPWAITPWLQVRNEIAIEVPADSPSDPRPFGEVRLEIE